MKKGILSATLFSVLSFLWIASTYARDLLTISGSTVTVTNDWVNAVRDSATSLLTTVFEILKFLPIIALIIWGFFVLNKIFGIVRSAWWGWK